LLRHYRGRDPLHEEIGGVGLRLQPEALYGFSDVMRIFGVTGLPQALKQGIEHLLARGFRRGLWRQGFLELLGFRTGFCAVPRAGAATPDWPAGLRPSPPKSSSPKPSWAFFVRARPRAGRD